MGKRNKKTTWRNLPIDDKSNEQQCSSVTISDSDESHTTINSCHSTPITLYQQHRQRYHDSSGRGGTGAAVGYSQRYSNRYDPTASSTRYHTCQSDTDHGYTTRRFDRRPEGGRPHSGVAFSRGGGRNLRDGIEGDRSEKITFNEDEYTRITTPRQDVLFKKGYLNRPRPSLSLSLSASSPLSPTTTTTTTTTTTDGSASGMELINLTPDALLHHPPHLITADTPFCYPTTGYIARDGLYFFNGFEPYPVVLYNTAPPQYCYTDFSPTSRSKRYSTDSMTESTTSPHTEEHSGGDGDPPPFLPPPTPPPPPSSPITATIQTPKSITSTRRNHQQPIDTNGTLEQRKLKKKRRRKLSVPINIKKKVGESTTTSVSVSEEDSNSNSTSSTDTDLLHLPHAVERQTSPDILNVTTNTNTNTNAAELAQESPSTCPNSPQSGSSSASSSSSITNSTTTTTTTTTTTEDIDQSVTASLSSQLKPDAKEFVPRHCAYNNLSDLSAPSTPIEFFTHQNQSQYHLIEPYNMHAGQPATFLPLPILLSPLAVGPPHYILPPPPPPPPPYNTLTHLPDHQQQQQQMDILHQHPVVISQQSEQLDTTGHNNHTRVIKSTELDNTIRSPSLMVTAKIPSNVQLDKLPTATTVVKPHQNNNLSKDDIRIIVSKLEEAAKEQENVVRTNQRNYSNEKRFNHSLNKSSIEGSPPPPPNRSTSNNKSINNQFKTNSIKNNNSPQRKPYSNFFNPSPSLNQNQSATLTIKSPPVKTSQNNQGISKKAASSSSPAKTSPQKPINTCPIKDQGTNQWISVSNRKKRRSNNTAGLNHGYEQTDDDTETCVEPLEYSLDKSKQASSVQLLVMKECGTKGKEEVHHVDNHIDDGFERYDVNKLVDVVVKPCDEDQLPLVQMISLVEQQIIAPCDDLTVEKVVDDIQSPQKEVTIIVQEVCLPEKEIKEVIEEFVKIKQNNKKGNTKNNKQVKRVMVTDNIPSITAKESPVKKGTEPKKTELTKQQQEAIPKKEPAATINESAPKSSKTKSKKKSSANQTKSTSTIETAASIASSVFKEDCPSSSGSYNFVSSNSEEKTNVEVSQELDMIIQRGMYSSLEEKIRSFNITASNDGFFKTINYYGTNKLDMNTTNSPGNKDFHGILKDLKPALQNSNFDLGKITAPKDISQIMTKQNNGYQDFLGLGPDLYEPDKDNLPTGTTNAPTRSNLSREVSPQVTSLSSLMAEEDENYPITRAVKEWMTKTREHTPEIELLKSPTTILRQYTVSSSEIDTVEEEEQEEITLWTLSNQDSVEADQDLLDCWETEDIAQGVKSNQMDAKSKSLLKIDNKEDCFVEVELKMSNSVGQGYEKTERDLDEDGVLEVYESRYGRNEDFVQIRDEWEERSKSGGNTPPDHNDSDGKHRNVIPPTASLPYRAICCTIM